MMKPSLALPLVLSALWLLGGILQPLGFVPTLALIACVIIAVVMRATRANRDLAPPTLARLGPLAAAGLGAGVGVIGLAVTHLIAWGLLPLWPEGKAELGRLSSLVMAEWPAALAFLSTALIATAEELLWRGLGARALSARLPGQPYLALSLGTLWYAVCQAGLGAALPIAAALVLGAVTGLLRLWTGGLAAPVAMHLVWTLGVVWVVPP